MTAAAARGATLVEYGASDETKAEMLLRQTAASGESVFRCLYPDRRRRPRAAGDAGAAGDTLAGV